MSNVISSPRESLPIDTKENPIKKFSKEQKDIILSWLKKYNLDIDKYFIYDDFKLLEQIFFKEYVVV